MNTRNQPSANGSRTNAKARHGHTKVDMNQPKLQTNYEVMDRLSGQTFYMKVESVFDGWVTGLVLSPFEQYRIGDLKTARLSSCYFSEID